jgi:hypothetical protein
MFLLNYIGGINETSFCQGELHMQKKLLGIISVDFDIQRQLFCINRRLERKWEYNEAVHQLFIDFKKTYDSVRREGGLV